MNFRGVFRKYEILGTDINSEYVRNFLVENQYL